MARAGGEDRGLAAVRRPLDVAAQVPDDRVGADVAQAGRLLLGPDQRANAMPATQQEGDDALPEPAMGAGDQHEHPHILARVRPRQTADLWRNQPKFGR